MNEYQFTEEELQILLDNIDVVLINQNIQEIEQVTLSQLKDAELDEITVAFGGLTDPIGQLQDWIAGVISDFSEWIVSSVSGLISSFSDTISNLINSGISSVLDSINGVINTVTSTINQGISQILSAIQNVIITPLTDLINEATNFLTVTLPDAVNDAIKNFQESLTSILSTITDQVSSIINQVISSLQTIPEQVASIISTIADQIQDVFKSVTSTVDEVVSQIIKSLQEIPGQIGEAVSGIVEEIQKGLSGLVDSIRDIVAQITQTIEGIPEAIQGMVSQISERIGEIVSSIQESLQGLVTGLSDQIGNIISSIQESLQGIVDSVQKTFTEVQEGLQNIMTSLQENINILIEAVKDMPSFLMKSISDVQAWIWEQLPEELKKFLEEAPKSLLGLGQAFQGFINAILRFPEWFPRWFEDHISKPISSAIGEIGKTFWELAPDWVKSGILSAQKFFDGLYESLKELFEHPLEWINKNIIAPIENVYKNLSKWVWEQMPQELKDIITWTKETFTAGWERIQKIFTEDLPNLVKWLQESVIPSLAGLWEGLVGFYETYITSFLEYITQPDKLPLALTGFLALFITPFIDFFKEQTKQIIQAFYELSGEIFRLYQENVEIAIKQVIGIVKGIRGAITPKIWDELIELSKLGASDVKRPFDAFVSPMVEGLSKKVMATLSITLNWEKIYKEKKLILPEGGEMAHLVNLLWGTIFALAGMRVLGGLITQLGHSLPADLEIPITFLDSLGIRFKFNLSWFITEMGKVFFQEPAKILNWTVEYLTFWYARMYTRPLSATFRDFIPVELPRPDVIVELARRMLPHKESTKALLMMKNIMALYGYSTPLITQLLSTKDEPLIIIPTYGLTLTPIPMFIKNYITYKDRFGRERAFPLSILYRVPDESTLAMFMVRDIFQTIDDFISVIKARGVYEDTAYLYYLARFKYPSPEKLYEFWARAQAGMLWYIPPKELHSKAEEEAERIGAFKPAIPYKLNIGLESPDEKTSKLILSAISTYMKWHDYALFSWYQDPVTKKSFVSDAYLWLDLMADIPLRIDARWMYKWSVFSAIMGWSPDELGLGRIIIARKTHPLFVPAVTVAECMNALTEERTFFRTGILNAFNYNILDIKSVANIFAGMFKLKFKVPVYNVEKNVYEIKEVEMPVRFLEGEAKLMILRSLYDRALRFYREIQRTLYLMIGHNYEPTKKYVEHLKNVSEAINKALTEVAKTYGVEAGFKIQFDEVFAPILETSVKLRNAYYTLQRLRYWLRWSLYQLWYRFQRGFISDEELDNFVNQIVDRLKLTDQEKEFFVEIAKFFRDIYRREYRAKAIIKRYQKAQIDFNTAVNMLIELGMDKETAIARLESEARIYVPTIQTLATLSEVVPEAIQLMPKVMDAQGIPPEEREIWKKYVILKPIRDEVSKFVTEIIMDYAKGVISKIEFESYLNAIKPFGYSDLEIEWIKKLAELRRRRYAK